VVLVRTKERTSGAHACGEYRARCSCDRLMELAGSSPERQKLAENGEDVPWAMASAHTTRKAEGLERIEHTAPYERIKIGGGGNSEGGGWNEYLDAVPRRERTDWFSEGMTSGKCA